MTTTVTLQLPDELAQELQEEAQRQNTTLENIVAQRLKQLSAKSQGSKHSPDEQRSLQKDYGDKKAVNPTDINSLEDFFEAVRSAIETEQPIIQAPVNEVYLGIAESLKRSGVLLDIQSDDQTLTLYINPTPPPSVIPSLPDIDSSELDPKIAKIIEDLKHEDGMVRYQSIQEIAHWYEQSA
jgi:hypothetical protein